MAVISCTIHLNLTVFFSLKTLNSILATRIEGDPRPYFEGTPSPQPPLSSPQGGSTLFEQDPDFDGPGMMDDSQLDASSSDGPGIQYDESERHTPSPDGGSPSEGESLQLEPPSEGGASPPEPPSEGGASPPEPPTEPPMFVLL